MGSVWFRKYPERLRCFFKIKKFLGFPPVETSSYTHSSSYFFLVFLSLKKISHHNELARKKIQFCSNIAPFFSLLKNTPNSPICRIHLIEFLRKPFSHKKDLLRTFVADLMTYCTPFNELIWLHFDPVLKMVDWWKVTNWSFIDNNLRLKQ